MNLLAFLWLVGCIAAVCIAFAVDDDVWHAIAERIRNPRPSNLEELHRHWEAQDRLWSMAPSDGDDSDSEDGTPNEQLRPN